MQVHDSESRPRRGASADIAEPSGLAARITLWLGAALSVALVAGVAYWAYQLGVRDATEVPVIRALAGLPRERPVDPGGQQVPHQGLAVNEVLGGSESAETVQSAAIAPAGSGLMADDIPMQADPTLPVETGTSLTPTAESQEVAPAGETEPAIPPPATTLADAPAPVILDIPRPLRRLARGVAPSDDSALSDAIAAALAQQTDGASATALPTPPQTDTAGDTPAVPLGTRMIQLGAFDAESAAIEQWDILQAAHPQLFANLQRYVERRQAGGRVFYRLRALGFADLDGARNMCAALLAREVQCITVTARE